MNSLLVVLHVGLYLATLIIVGAICVLYVRTFKLEKLVSVGGGRSLIGFEVPRFEAVDSRTGVIITVEKNVASRLCILFVSSNCYLCQKLIHALQEHAFENANDAKSPKLIIYCQGSARGSVSLLDGMNDRVTTLVAHNEDLTALLPIGSVPALLEIDSQNRVTRHTYPFSAQDILTLLYESSIEPSSHES